MRPATRRTRRSGGAFAISRDRLPGSMEASAKTAPFKSILCGVEGNPASTIAARASIALQTPETSLRFVAVDASFELRPEYTKESLEAAMAEAMKLAEEAGVTATSDMPAGKYASKVLLAEAQNHDLLVVGTHNQSRVSGIVLGSTASETVHETERPLLIAREPSERRVPRLDPARHRWQRGLQGRGRGRRGPGGRLRREAGGAARLGRQAIRLRRRDGGRARRDRAGHGRRGRSSRRWTATRPTRSSRRRPREGPR